MNGPPAPARPTLESTEPRGQSTSSKQEAETRAMDVLVKELMVQFPDAPSGTVLAVVTAAHHRFDGSPIRDFIPILVGREARDLLRERVDAA